MSKLEIMTNEEKEDALLRMQIRNQAILETILQTQIRILSKVKKERYEYTNTGITRLVNDTEIEMLKKFGLEPEDGAPSSGGESLYDH